MRIIFDTNIWLSYFNSTNQNAFIYELIQQTIQHGILIIIFPELHQEIITKLATKPRLSQKITIKQVEQTFQIIETICIQERPTQFTLHEVTRDKKDDFLITYAVEHDIDCIITWDKDLLTLKGKIQRLSIVSPTQFLKTLKQQSPSSA